MRQPCRTRAELLDLAYAETVVALAVPWLPAQRWRDDCGGALCGCGVGG